MKTLEEFDFPSQCPKVSALQIQELALAGYIVRVEPIIFQGTAGPTRPTCWTGLAVAACRQKRRIRGKAREIEIPCCQVANQG